MNKHLEPTLPLIFLLQYMGLHSVSQPSPRTSAGEHRKKPPPRAQAVFSSQNAEPLRTSPVESGSEEDNPLPSRHLAAAGRTGEPPLPHPHPHGCQWELHSKVSQKPDPGHGFPLHKFCSFSKSNLKRTRESECKS